MSEKIKYSMSVQVVGGTSIPITGEITPDAYKKIQMSVPAHDTDVKVDLQCDASNLVEFLLIKSSSYIVLNGGTKKVSYKVNDGATVRTLDGPHVFIGKGAVEILAAIPKQLSFSNTLDSDITIDILVGRDAGPNV